MYASDIAGLCPPLKPGKQSKIRGNLIVTCCPVCQPDGPKSKTSDGHLCLEDKEGWAHVHCSVFKCPEESILKALGLTQDDRRHETKARPEIARRIEAVAKVEEPALSWVPYKEEKVLARYDYKKASGAYALSKIRLKNPNNPKDFRCLVIDGDKCCWSLTHLNGSADILYNYPRVIQAILTGETIYINEGEKACDRMAAEGLAATCQRAGSDPHGAKWLDLHTAMLSGAKDIVIVADNDPANDQEHLSHVGQRYAAAVCQKLKDARLRARVVCSKTTGSKDDAYDHFEAGYTAAEFVARPDLMPSRGFQSVQFDDTFKPIELEYILDPYLPKGKCILFDADGGVGKTSMVAAWAAYLSRGQHPITYANIGEPINILYLHRGEDSSEEIHTVFMANGGDPTRMNYPPIDIQESLQFDEAGLALLEDAIEDMNIGLVIVDALFYFIEKVAKDSNNSLDVSAILRMMNRVAERTRATFWDIRHTVKGGVGVVASNLGMGSAAFRNSHRGQMLARWHPEEKGIVVVEDHKGSLLNPKGEPFMFRRVGLQIEYVWNMANPFDPNYAPKMPHQFGGAKQDARSFILEYLADGAKLSTDMETARLAKGISYATMRRAKDDMKAEGLITNFQNPKGTGPWYCVLNPVDQKPYDAFSDY